MVDGRVALWLAGCVKGWSAIGQEIQISILFQESSMRNASEKVMSDLVQLGIESKAHYQIWWALEYSAKPRFLRIMNRFVDYFEATRIAHFNSMIMSICAIHDNDPQTSNMKKCLTHAKQIMNHNEFDNLECNVAKLNSRMGPIRGIRDYYIAHRNAGMTIEEIFDKHEIIPDMVRDIVLDTTKIINATAREQGVTNVIFESDRSSQSILSLLGALE